MIVYSYDKETNIFLGSRKLRKDFLNGGYMPKKENETEVVPPEIGENQNAVFNIKNETWTIISDYRGEIFYDKSTGDKYNITRINVTINTNWTSVPPPTIFYHYFDDSTNSWQIDIDKYKEYILTSVSNESFSICRKLFPQYKIINVLAGVTTYEDPFTIENYTLTATACREEYYRIEDLLKEATTIDEVSSIYQERNFPTEIVTGE